MGDQLITTTQRYDLVLTTQTPLDRNPAAVYLDSLSESGRRTQRTALNKIAAMLTGNDVGHFNFAHLGLYYFALATIQ